MTPEQQKAYDDARQEILAAVESTRRGQPVTKLKLARRGLVALPPELWELTTLTELDLNNNELTALPPEIARLTALTRLDLIRNPVMALPREIGQLTALTHLSLAFTGLTTLPPEIGKLTKLTWLGVDHNELTALPPEIWQLRELTDLHISGNRLTALPPEIQQLRELTSLYASFNQLTALPPEVGRLTELRVLALSDNQLTLLPPEIGQLTRLGLLFCSGNQLTTLPPELGRLTALSCLDLSENHLTTLPAELGDLALLSDLKLQENRLTSLPHSLTRLPELTHLFLHGNPALLLPPEVLGPTCKEVNPGPDVDEDTYHPREPANPRDILRYYFSHTGGSASQRSRKDRAATIAGVVVLFCAVAYAYKLWRDAVSRPEPVAAREMKYPPAESFPDGKKYAPRFRGFTLPPVVAGRWKEAKAALEAKLGDGVIFIQAVPAGTSLAIQAGVNTMGYIRNSADVPPVDGWAISEGIYDRPDGGKAKTWVFQKTLPGVAMEFWVPRE